MSTPATPDAAPESATTILDSVPGEWKRVSPKYLTVELVSSIITTVVLTGVMLIPTFASGIQGLIALPIVAFVILAITTALTPRRVRAIGYQLRDDDLVVRKGIMFLRVVAVPYGRMQLVDINRGPLARAFGLSELKLVTAAAASHITIPGLPEAEAEQLRDRLVELAESRRAGL